MLEIGCGAGLALSLLATRAKHVVGIDRSPKQIALARARTPNVRLESIAFEEAPAVFGAGSFDRILAVNVNAFRLAPEESLPSLVSLLRPRGKLVLAWESPARELVAVVGVARGR